MVSRSVEEEEKEVGGDEGTIPRTRNWVKESTRHIQGGGGNVQGEKEDKEESEGTEGEALAGGMETRQNIY